MPTVHAFHVVPALPDSLDRLRELAFNIQWAWNHEAIELFRRLDRDLWESSGHNPVRMLGTISQERLREIAQDDGFLAELDRVRYGLENYLKAQNTWFTRNWKDKVSPDTRIAYFSMEFGMTECLPIYSGGLGVLSGDHLSRRAIWDCRLWASACCTSRAISGSSSTRKAGSRSATRPTIFTTCRCSCRRTRTASPCAFAWSFRAATCTRKSGKSRLGASRCICSTPTLTPTTTKTRTSRISCTAAIRKCA